MDLWKLCWIGTISKNIPLLEETQVLKIVFVSIKMEAAFQIG